MRVWLWLIIGAMWLAASVALLIALKDTPRGESVYEWIFVSLLAPGVLVAIAGLFLGLWYFLFHVTPRAIMRQAHAAHCKSVFIK